MLMGKEFDPFFAQIVRTLGPYLDDVLCIGGCANALYRFHDLASPICLRVLQKTKNSLGTN